MTHQDADGKPTSTLPVFGSVAEAIKETGADVSVVFVPPAFTKDAVIEAIDAEIGLLVHHHRGCSGAGLGRVLGLRAGQGDPDHRAQLPGHHHPR